MQPPFDFWLTTAVAADISLAAASGAPALAERRQRRLAAVVGAAQQKSPLYRRWLGHADARRLPLHELPVTRKHELMRHFDEWCTDPAISIDALRRFFADPAQVARPFLGRYVVWESSGSGGEPGYFVQDAAAMAVYDALEALRKPRPAPLRQLLDPWGVTDRVVFVGALDGHFASTVSIERLRRLNPVLAARVTSVSFLQPADRLAAELQALAPTVLATYPSAAVMFAEQALAGRLSIAPREVRTGGETLTPPMRRRIEEAFGCTVVDSYGASECLALACECGHGSLHLNSDWAIVEPVDENGQPVPAGRFGATTLVTNLANQVQPLIRYDIGDQVALHEAACRCGSALPVIEVRGRSDDTLRLRAAGSGGGGGGGDRLVAVLPLAVSTVLEEGAGLHDFQLVQQGPGELTITSPADGSDEVQRLQRAREVLAGFLREQGADVQIHCRCGVEPLHGRSGKVKRVVAAEAG